MYLQAFFAHNFHGAYIHLKWNETAAKQKPEGWPNPQLTRDLISPYGDNEKLTRDLISPYDDDEKLTRDLISPYDDDEKLTRDLISPYDDNEKLTRDLISPYDDNEKLTSAEENALLIEIINKTN